MRCLATCMQDPNAQVIKQIPFRIWVSYCALHLHFLFSINEKCWLNEQGGLLAEHSEFMGKTFQAAQLTHERFLTIDMLHIVLHTRGRWKFSLADIKKIFCRSDVGSKSSHVLVVAAWNVFPIHLLLWLAVFKVASLVQVKKGRQIRKKPNHPSFLPFQFHSI